MKYPLIYYSFSFHYFSIKLLLIIGTTHLFTTIYCIGICMYRLHALNTHILSTHNIPKPTIVTHHMFYVPSNASLRLASELMLLWHPALGCVPWQMGILLELL